MFVKGLQRGSLPWLMGLRTSLRLAGLVLLVALLLTLLPGAMVYLSQLFYWGMAGCCLGGGYTAGRMGGTRGWLAAGGIGLVTGGAALALLIVAAPGSVTTGELVARLLGCALLSCTGALAGANGKARRKLPHSNLPARLPG